jgi:hypothetical protein
MDDECERESARAADPQVASVRAYCYQYCYRRRGRLALPKLSLNPATSAVSQQRGMSMSPRFVACTARVDVRRRPSDVAARCASLVE